MVTSPGQLGGEHVKHIIHAVGPKFNSDLSEEDNVDDLIATVKNALR
jgi:O-acetyl-ADP-ribose deacetylase (regulator of RNase III)